MVLELDFLVVGRMSKHAENLPDDPAVSKVMIAALQAENARIEAENAKMSTTRRVHDQLVQALRLRIAKLQKLAEIDGLRDLHALLCRVRPGRGFQRLVFPENGAFEVDLRAIDDHAVHMAANAPDHGGEAILIPIDPFRQIGDHGEIAVVEANRPGVPASGLPLLVSTGGVADGQRAIEASLRGLVALQALADVALQDGQQLDG